jgi:hypothetical protein
MKNAPRAFVAQAQVPATMFLAALPFIAYGGCLPEMVRTPLIPTLEQLRRTPWCWVVCEECLQPTPMAFVPLTIRWGPALGNAADLDAEDVARG